MKTCFECKTEVLDAAEFCHKCGRQVTRRVSNKSSSQNSGGGHDTQLLAKSKEELGVLRAQIERKASRRNTQVFIFFGILGLIAWVLYQADPPKMLSLAHMIAMYGGVILAAILLQRPNRWLTSAEYYSITGSGDLNEKHRCIFCGNKGIYKKGEYRTDNTYARCSKCQEPLFKE